MRGDRGEPGEPGPAGKFLSNYFEIGPPQEIVQGPPGSRGWRGDPGYHGQKGEHGYKGPPVRASKNDKTRRNDEMFVLK
jgi:collagen type IV alpha